MRGLRGVVTVIELYRGWAQGQITSCRTPEEAERRLASTVTECARAIRASIRPSESVLGGLHRLGRQAQAALHALQVVDQGRAAGHGQHVDHHLKRLEGTKQGQGLSPVEASVAAQKEVKFLMAGLDALHSPDLIAGGNNNPTPGDFGDRSVNRSIGGQWPQNDRVTGIDRATEKVPESEHRHTKMNVKMSRCPRRGK